jgi:hypothetical protein
MEIDLSLEQLEKYVNIGVKKYLQYLSENEFVEKEMYHFLAKNTAVILKKPAFFHTFWNKIINGPNDFHYIVVVQMSMNEPKTKGIEEKTKGKLLKLLKKEKKT